ncbi:peptidase M20D [Lojkania enalia]|uniref:Peptidase M20D n=1 Tax=Lojkania enalia TaxID=147567 RepID=A0A9P4TRT5_9PLEO|nr:peptidase M20D [Didymosphaeria enalia]
MNMSFATKVLEAHRPDLGPYEELYKHFHANPELSFQEAETAAKIVAHLKSLVAYDVFASIGGHGVAALLRNGEGGKVLLRADIDGLPVEERSGVAYQSRRRAGEGEGKGVMHACGHDMHITALLAAADTLVASREAWAGTVVLVFQPAEEKGAGARAMVEDGLYDKVPVPDVVIGAHVMPYRAGVIGTKRGLIASSADSFHLTLHGRQAHASMPARSIDPIVLAASTILRLQTIVSREVDPADFGVVTVSSCHAGDAENIIPDHADLKLNIRAEKPATRSRLLTSMRRIIDAETSASNAPAPTLEPLSNFPFLFNDDNVTDAIAATFAQHFEVGKCGFDTNIARLSGSEDFGILATSVGRPSCFFLYGGTDPEVYDKAEEQGSLDELPSNHSPFFVPVIQPTLGVAVDGYVGAALTFLRKG